MLPPPEVPFAVRPMPDVRPDLWPLAREVPGHVEDAGPRTLVRLDREVVELVAAKREALARDPAPWTAASPLLGSEAAVQVGLRLAAAVAEAVPALLDAGPDAITIPGTGVRVGADGTIVEVAPDPAAPVLGDPQVVLTRLAAVEPAHRPLEAVALAVAEDLVVVDRDGRALWLHVCAPSGWDPGSAGGAYLAALHGPVPDADRLRAASASLARAITGSGPHVRWVWGLTDDPAAAHHPRSRGAVPPVASPGDLTFRAERQTTLPLSDLGLGVFLIRVHRAPLRTVVTSDERRSRLLATVDSLSEDLATYKGITCLRRPELARWIAGLEVGSATSTAVGQPTTVPASPEERHAWQTPPSRPSSSTSTGS